MKVADVMTRRVVFAKPETTVIEAARLMLQDGISGLPVIDGKGELVGIVTEGDFLRRSETHTERRRARWLELLLGPGRLAEDYVRSHGRKVEEIMTQDVATVTGETPLAEAVRLMEKRRVKRLPVLHGRKVVGIISRADFMQALTVLSADDNKSAAASDDAIRATLMAELAKQPWGSRATTNVVVRDGIVELHGTILDDRQREALRVAAENIPGVTAVHDHLAWVEPTSGFVLASPEDAPNSQQVS
ncbi:MAG TPA: CBS domain-containing protein [Stellaceae bacterium]|nr:CBS domain-containing protein [Stellaceae bacterium]